MADVIKSLYEGQPATTDTLLYTAPATPTAVRNIHICNTTGSAATITLGLNAGGALGVTNEWLTAFSVAANGTYDWSGFAVVSASGTIRALQGTSGALTVTISGVET